ncbi:hypothetical protein YW3DRAFT_07322 [Streptomyces sp. MnatMP-M77]|uniref:hypothetical protein n=1 Tax=unclassified Streptomyces TaxID=2593676 RepID=UPI000804EDF8|nr:hypothetical protein [Streptomyces sp. MnatMP-M77]MYT80230.1 hypothetical protein [Streptomyces sp. SID8364]SBV06092.1 hypothetical protein YW3DRAFT_07322 [Streptomyces sp. MnatMP-M77]
MLAEAGFDPGVEFGHFVVMRGHRAGEAADELGAQFLAPKAVIWDWAASTARTARAPADWTLRSRSEFSKRLTPMRRITTGVW